MQKPSTGQANTAASLEVTTRLANVEGITLEAREARSQFRGFGRAVPSRRYRQWEIFHLLGYEKQTVAETIFEKSGIDYRYLSREPEQLAQPLDPYGQFTDVIQAAVPLAEEACRKALEDAGVTADQIDCFIVTSTSVMMMPSLSNLLTPRLGLPRHLTRYDQVGAGCLGAIPTLTMADQYLASHPGHKVLAVCVEIGSQFLHPTPDKLETVVNTIFSDAAAALVLDRAPANDAVGPEMVDVQFLQGTDILDSAEMWMAPDGVRNVFLHRELPDRASELFKEASETLLTRHGLTKDEIKHFAFHPGGRAILDQVQGALGLTDDEMAASRTALRNYGNASSPTCLLALTDALRDNEPKPGEWGLLGAIGPGLTAGLILLKW